MTAVLLPEVGHLLRDHAGRASNLPTPRNQLPWNLAGDAEINDDLIAAGVPFPEGCVTPAALGCADGDLAETYYAVRTRPRATPLAAGCPTTTAGYGSGSGCPRSRLSRKGARSRRCYLRVEGSILCMSLHHRVMLQS